jgi:hypothetical protein
MENVGDKFEFDDKRDRNRCLLSKVGFTTGNFLATRDVVMRTRMQKRDRTTPTLSARAINLIDRQKIPQRAERG